MRISFTALILIAFLLTGCATPPPPNLQHFPTAIHTPVIGAPAGQTPDSSDLPTPMETATPAGTPAPAIVLPDAVGVFIACEANTLRLPLTTPDGDAFRALTRIEALDDDLYLIGNGSLYRIPLESVITQAPRIEEVIFSEQIIAGRPVQELVDIEISKGQVYVLDKAGHVFRYDIATGQTTIAYRAHWVEDDIDPHLIALTTDSRNNPVILDTSRGTLDTPDEGISTLTPINEARGLTSGVDVTRSDDTYYVLVRDNFIRSVSDEIGSSVWLEVQGPQLALSLKVSDHLGSDLLVMVDGLRREVTGITLDQRVLFRTVIAFPEIGLLRDAVFAGERMFSIADGDLYVYPAPDSGEAANCASQPTADWTPNLMGVDIIATLYDATIPLEGEWEFPPWPRVNSGASRLYRSGIHHGVDFYSYTGPSGFKTGWPVLAAAGGTVERATLGYMAVTEEEFDIMLGETERLGYTPPAVMERLAGRHVIIEHTNGIRTVYMHLDEIAPGVVPGAQVQAGQEIGTVGVTGTQGEFERGAVGPHLHFETWIGDYYLGYGMTIREAMWWVKTIYGR